MKTLAQVKRQYMFSVIRKTKGNIMQSSKILGITRRALYLNPDMILFARTLRLKNQIRIRENFLNNQTAAFGPISKSKTETAFN